MRRGFGVGAAILVILLVVGIGIGAYNWGLNDGIDQSGKAVEVVRYVGHGGFGFFPFFLFFPLLFLGLFAFKGAMWRRHGGYGHGPGGHGPGGHAKGHGGWEQGFEDWHRRQHEVGTGGADAGGEPSGGGEAA
jgi:hypothetical protein